MSYGVVSKNQILDTVNYVCNILGHGKNNNAVHLLMETARAEIQRGFNSSVLTNEMGERDVGNGAF